MYINDIVMSYTIIMQRISIKWRNVQLSNVQIHSPKILEIFMQWEQWSKKGTSPCLGGSMRQVGSPGLRARCPGCCHLLVTWPWQSHWIARSSQFLPVPSATSAGELWRICVNTVLRWGSWPLLAQNPGTRGRKLLVRWVIDWKYFIN